jgi:hypothetical protein
MGKSSMGNCPGRHVAMLDDKRENVKKWEEFGMGCCMM